eukprot:299657_1
MNRGQKMKLKQQKQRYKHLQKIQETDVIMSNSSYTTPKKTEMSDDPFVESINNIVLGVVHEVKIIKEQASNKQIKIDEMMFNAKNEINNSTSSLCVLLNRAQRSKSEIYVALNDSLDEKELDSLCQHQDDAERLLGKLHEQRNSQMQDEISKDAYSLQETNGKILKCEERVRKIRMKLDQLYEEQGNIEECLDKRKAIQSVFNMLYRDSVDEVRDAVDEVHGIIKENQATIKNEFQSILKERIEHFEQTYDEWDTSSVVSWIQMIENGYFGEERYQAFIKKVENLKIVGSRLKEIKNKLFLDLIGLNEKEQDILVNHIERVVYVKPKIRVEDLCGTCLSNKVNTVVVPCGHQYYCMQCVSKNRRMVRKRCPICRSRVRDIIQTYMSGSTMTE